MKKYLVTAIAASSACLAALTGAQAADPACEAPIEVTVQLGTASNDMVITPSNLTFERGKYYKIVLKNPSGVEHRLSVAFLAAAVKTLSKPVVDRGTVKGALRFTLWVPYGYLPREIDIGSGGVAEWHFIPVRQVSAKVGCIINSHAKAGMVADFNVT